MEGKSVQRAQLWQDKLIAALNNNRSRERYVMVRTLTANFILNVVYDSIVIESFVLGISWPPKVLEKHLVGILLLVFVREMHQRSTKEAYGATVGVGVMGMMGNKGGASIRIKFYDSTICFGMYVCRSKQRERIV